MNRIMDYIEAHPEEKLVSGLLAEEKRTVKAKETLDFYLPLARKVNNRKLLEELNDLGRKYL